MCALGHVCNKAMRGQPRLCDTHCVPGCEGVHGMRLQNCEKLASFSLWTLETRGYSAHSCEGQACLETLRSSCGWWGSPSQAPGPPLHNWVSVAHSAFASWCGSEAAGQKL